MRDRKEIESEEGPWRRDVDHGQTANDTSKILEVLLDIRDLLDKGQ